MAYGHYEGKDISDPELRRMFDREEVLKSDWYKARLKLKQEKDVSFYKKQIAYLEDFKANKDNAILVDDMQIDSRIEMAKNCLKRVESKQYLSEIEGTIGADPLFKK